ncbi:hypothetical protein AVEN_208798-1 [Araneus ventricosus]|uniref:Uncharacterized protein n=1 Tax=Araneus ventricosus TaxID=182803 RepID=A0A4Y2LIT1_ARAVE|nr:hypothetical protein AVEN_208798-1 [Araneus ventricosus]
MTRTLSFPKLRILSKLPALLMFVRSQLLLTLLSALPITSQPRYPTGTQHRLGLCIYAQWKVLVRVPDKTTVLKTRADNSEEQNLQSKHTGEMSGITFDKAKFNVGLRDNVINMLGKIESSVKSNTKVSN